MATDPKLASSPTAARQFAMDEFAMDLPELKTEQTWSQLSVSQLFLLMTLVAFSLMIYQVAGFFWSAMILLLIVCWRVPGTECNPLLQALAYALVTFVVAMLLAVAFNIPPLLAIWPCCFAPALAYLIGFHKSFFQDA